LRRREGCDGVGGAQICSMGVKYSMHDGGVNFLHFLKLP
jgi:hypothetical protein